MKNLLLSAFLLLSCYVFAQPANNACASATTLTTVTTCGAVGTQSLYQATATGSPTSPYGTTYDVWYRFTPAAGKTSVNITLSGTGGGISNTNTFIEAFESTTCAGISTTTSLGVGTRQTGLTISNLAVGTQYYFRVFTNTNPTSSAANWAFSICLQSPAAPGNDNCAGSTLLTVGTTTTNQRLTNATSSGVALSGAPGVADDDVWYRFVANSSTAVITVNPNPVSGASSTTFASGANVQVFSGACAGLTSIAYGERGSCYATGLTNGATYYIRVYTGGAFGTSAVAAPSTGAVFSILVHNPTTTTVGSGRFKEMYSQTTLSLPNILNDPWEVTYGSDGYLWITESKGSRVIRMDPATGARTTVLDLGWKSDFFSSASDKAFNVNYELAIQNPQGGFAGLAIHPKFLDPTTPKNFVYVSYVHSFNGGTSPTGTFFTNRLVRFTYNPTTNKLESPVALCDSLPGSNDHNSQRLIIAPVGGTNYLFYAAGDMGAGQFGNRDRPNKAQNPNAYEGKILRYNLESDGDAGFAAWVPNSNPYSSTSAVWSIGIRNNQGFAYDTSTGKLYGTSHGPYSDDELNMIKGGMNYGHPLVIGYAADDNYNGSTAGAAKTDNNGVSACPMIVDESTAAAAIVNYQDPVFSAYAQSQATINNIWVNNPGNGGWPSEGWSGLDIYKHTLIPGWKNSLVASSLKWGRLVRMKLGGLGDTTVAKIDGTTDTASYFGSTNRYRDVAIASNGKDMYVIMDKSTTTSGPSAANPVVPACQGCLQKYTFLGYADASGKSTIPNFIPVTSGTSNTCNTGTTITIDATNNNIWVPITGPDGNILAEIYANGNNLGTVTSSFYQHSGPTRVRNNGRYLNRNITITPQNQPTLPGGSPLVKIRLYLSKAEFDALDIDPLSGVNAITDLKILKNQDPCGSGVASNTTAITPTFAEAFGANGYMIQGNISSFSSFYLGSASITLPLQLLSFRGTLQNTATLLQWETANETNTSHFIVERSIDNNTFDAIGTVAANGNTTTNSQYSYLDNDAANQPANILYYRLKLVDRDGTATYSSTITITLADIAGRVSLYPNPARESVKLSVSAAKDGHAQWKIVDNSGRVVMKSSMNLKKGNNNVMIDINKLAGGLYYLTVTGDGIDQKVKLQKL